MWFRFERVESISYSIEVMADSEEEAHTKATVGPMSFVRQKEGVEVVSSTDTPTVTTLKDSRDEPPKESFMGRTYN